ncbi:A/G-specific adenine glycosylase [Candidatus Uhrbacteria bacterium]|nr:A/G-specific adenine glycosylase [Candidatus Uhrbacteria bacterium]
MNLSNALLRWYKKYGRDLPWRKTRDPYRILVSEIMLQQTQVPRVVLFYKKWLKEFPNWKALARASNAQVIHAWAGLGYNRRGLMLRDIARELSSIKHQIPKTEEGWRSLKGIGPYTAAALAVFSLRKRVLPIDTNIRRTAGRILLGKPFPQPADDDRIRSHASRFTLRVSRFYDIPQALFDLATKICTKTPSCVMCPMRSTCLAAPKFLSGRVRVPKQMVKKSFENKHRDKPYPDRIYRGRILKVVRESIRGISVDTLGLKIDPKFNRVQDQTWLLHMIDRMIKDGFLERKKANLIDIFKNSC